MKAEFELNIDSRGRPCIRFNHYDKNLSLEQKYLKLFLDEAKNKGVKLVWVSSFHDPNSSVDRYEIQINRRD